MTIKACVMAAALMASPGLAPRALAQAGPNVTVQAAWARATTPGVPVGGAYLTLTSPGGDRLMGVSSPAAASASVHEMQMDGATMRMRAVEGGLPLPPGQAVTLKPGGYHIMLEGLTAPLRQGSTVPLHLVFQTAPPLDIQAPVEAIGASGPPGAASRPGGPAVMPGMGSMK